MTNPVALTLLIAQTGVIESPEFIVITQLLLNVIVSPALTYLPAEIVPVSMLVLLLYPRPNVKTSVATESWDKKSIDT
jgi:hypothetical protein